MLEEIKTEEVTEIEQLEEKTAPQSSTGFMDAPIRHRRIERPFVSGFMD